MICKDMLTLLGVNLLLRKETPKNITLNLTLFPLAESAGYLWLTMPTTDGNAHHGSTWTGIVLQEQHRHFCRTQAEFIHTSQVLLTHFMDTAVKFMDFQVKSWCLYAIFKI